MTDPTIDHVIQVRIIDQLFEYGTQSFSELQQSGVENSLFMYHARKLIARGVVEKCAEGFRLTAAGVRWANQSGDRYRPLRAPRLLVQLFVPRDDQLLISERIGHLAEHMNRYMLPGGVHEFGKTALENAERIADKFGVSLTAPTPIGTAEFIDTTTDYHGIVTYYEAAAPADDYTYHDTIFTTKFMRLADIDCQRTNLAEIIELYQGRNFPFTSTMRCLDT